MKTGVVLMTYGSPKTMEDITEYLKRVYGGKDASPEVIREFKRRYGLIGGSPLINITQDQARALEQELNKGGIKFKVSAGMRFSDPFIKDVIPELATGSDELIGIIMSPQYSPIIMGGYTNETEKAVANLQRSDYRLKMATDWHLEPYFLMALAERIKESLSKMSHEEALKIPILFSVHSMPKRVIEKEPGYINDLKETASEVAKLLKLKEGRFRFCYQSAGHTPEEWLKPDFADLMPELKRQGHKSVLIAPVQFLADHLEILYDIEIGAREQAEQNGIRFYRTGSLNTSPLFIKTLANLVNRLHRSQ